MVLPHIPRAPRHFRLVLSVMPQKGGEGERSQGPHAPTAPRPALERSAVVNLEGLEKVRLVVAANSNECGATQIRLGSWPRGERVSPAVLLHLHALLLGVLPPFSSFVDGVLSHYQIHALHLDTCSFILLSAFAFLCEAFVVITPSMELLRHFFNLELASEMMCSGFASLKIDDASVLGIPCVELLPEVEGFRCNPDEPPPDGQPLYRLKAPKVPTMEMPLFDDWDPP
ncbi:hypothetical protein D1007_15813 [Hordeum vulgare]|nr:hypothetical protein D1007_15813 [Hordeum vulgare]